MESWKTNKYFFSPLVFLFIQHLLGLLRFSPNEAELSHRPFNLAYGDGTEHFMFIAKAESFRNKMLAKGHHISFGLGQFVQLRHNIGILILNLMFVNL